MYTYTPAESRDMIHIFASTLSTRTSERAFTTDLTSLLSLEPLEPFYTFDQYYADYGVLSSFSLLEREYNFPPTTPPANYFSMPAGGMAGAKPFTPTISTLKKRQAEDDSGEQRKRRGQQVGKACTHCKAAHLACDDQRPCRRCVHMGKVGCVDGKND
jgi:hypothetical protein